MASISFPRFDKEKEEIRWFLDQCENSLIASDIKDEKKKVAIVCSALSQADYQELAKSLLPKSPRDYSWEELRDILQKLFSKTRDYITLIDGFYKRQFDKKNETLQKFYHDLIFRADEIGFSDKDLRIKEKLCIAVMTDKSVRAELVKFNVMTKTAAEVFNFLKIFYEESLDDSSPVNKVSYSSKKTNSNCKVCGKVGHSKENCKFKNSKCYICSKVGHLASVCQNKKMIKEKNDKPQVKSKFKKSTTNAVEEAVADSDSDIFSIDVNRTQVNKIGPYVINCVVDGVKLNFEVDTGSSISTIKKSDFDKLNKPILPDRTSLRAYNNLKIDVLGKTIINKFCTNNMYTNNVRLLIIENAKSNLLGRDLIEELNLINVVNKVDIDNYKVDINTPIKDFECRLFLKDNCQPVFNKARPVPFHLRDKIDESLQEMIDQNIISRIKYSEFAFPIVPVLKSNGKVRICVDFKKLNNIMQTVRYPLPNIDDLLTTLSGHKYYSKLDLSNAYLQIKVNESDKHFLTMNTHQGLFRYNRLPFGLSSSSGIFQNFMSLLLQPIQGVSAYLDDIIIVGNSKTEHDQRLYEVLEILESRNVKINFNKSVLSVNEIPYLGFVLNNKGYKPDMNKMKAILNAPKPQTVTQVKSFLGLIQFYSKFIPNFANKVAVLHELTKKNKKFEWTDKLQKTFEGIKNEFKNNDRILSKFDEHATMVLEVDASPYGVGCVLKQKHANNEYSTLGFASRKLTSAEVNYSQLDREGLAIIFGVRKFEKFLRGRKFILRTDHKPLVHIFNPNKNIPSLSNARLTRWSIILGSFNFDLEHISGSKNIIADYLSRSPIEDDELKFWIPPEYINLVENVEKLNVSIDVVKKAITQDTVLNSVKTFINKGFPRNSENIYPGVIPFLKIKEDLSIHDEIVLFRNRMVIPEMLHERFLDILHRNHNGIAHMKAEARKFIFWPNIDQDIESISKSCELCINNNAPKGVKISQWKEPELVWERVHIDYCHIDGVNFLIIVDAKSKFIDVHFSKSLNANVTIENLRKTFANFGVPYEIVSDNGPTFACKEFKDFLSRNKVKHTLIAPYHPQSNGLAERTVQTYKRMFSKFKDCSLQTKVSRTLFAYRSKIHSVTGQSPAEMMFGRSFRSPLSILKPKVSFENDNNTKDSKFKIGDAVFARNFGKGSQWVQARIIDVLSPYNYKVKVNCTDNIIWKRHVGRNLDSCWGD